jgi:hypothetical protein
MITNLWNIQENGFYLGISAAATFIESGLPFKTWYQGPFPVHSNWRDLLRALERESEYFEE